MSVYASFSEFCADGDYDAPYEYQKPHVIPRDTDPRGGVFELAFIPGYVRRADADSDEIDDDDVWPWLRVSLNGSDNEPDTIVLHANQVDSLIRELLRWRARVNRTLK